VAFREENSLPSGKRLFPPASLTTGGYFTKHSARPSLWANPPPPAPAARPPRRGAECPPPAISTNLRRLIGSKSASCAQLITKSPITVSCYVATESIGCLHFFWTHIGRFRKLVTYYKVEETKSARRLRERADAGRLCAIPIPCSNPFLAKAEKIPVASSERPALRRPRGMAKSPALSDLDSYAATRFEEAPSEAGTRDEERGWGERGSSPENVARSAKKCKMVHWIKTSQPMLPRGGLTSRDKGLYTAIKMRLFFGSRSLILVSHLEIRNWTPIA
jgi:hypothetical protein